MHTLTTSALSFAWPDGTVVFDDLSIEVPTGRNALVGANGTGKSTLLRLLAGELAPTSGSVTSTDRVGYLRQDLTLHADVRVDEHLGIAAIRDALAAITNGDADQRHFDVVGDAWDVEERAAAVLDRLGLATDLLDRPLGTLSGGEVIQLGLARLLLAEPDVLLLDEPTNNLDRRARERLYDVVDGFRGTLLTVSHDRELLERVERVADLHEGRIHWYGGNLIAYEEQIAIEQAAAAQALKAAQAEVRREQRDRQQVDRVLAGRRRAAAKAAENIPRIVAGAKQRKAEVSAAKYTAVHDDRLSQARERIDDAEARVREVTEIRVDLPDTVVPDRRMVLRTRGLVLRNSLAIDLDIDGPERIAITGVNGSGKTTLLHTLTGLVEPTAGSVDVRVPVRLLPQRLDLLEDSLSVADNVSRVAPTASVNDIRSRLARFAFRGKAADQLAGTLSGGERFRATLAALLLADPAPQLLLLDEPTNNLDFASQRQLVTALSSYGGALVVVSHDERFLDEIGITRRLDLGQPRGRGASAS